MLSFEEIEDCFPDGACSDDATGNTLVSAQWLHDFAHAVAAKEREACAKVCEGNMYKYDDDAEVVAFNAACGDCAAAIRARGGATVKDSLTAELSTDG